MKHEGSRQLIVALTSWRKRHAITQLEVADEMNVRQATISELENKDDCYVSTLLRYADAVDCELTFLLKPKKVQDVLQT